MKLQITFLFLFLFPILLIAQEDSTSLKNREKSKKEIEDSTKLKQVVIPRLPPRTLIIKMKDLSEIKNLKGNPFVIIDDTSNYTADELASGLSAKELAAYRKNKKESKSIMKPPPSEEETYLTIARIREILKVSKTVAVIIIAIISLIKFH